MIRVMRAFNAVFVAMFALFGIVQVVLNLGNLQKMLVALSGTILLAVPFLLAWRGLAPHSAVASVQTARRANIFFCGLMALFILAVAVYDERLNSVSDQ